MEALISRGESSHACTPQVRPGDPRPGLIRTRWPEECGNWTTAEPIPGRIRPPSRCGCTGATVTDPDLLVALDALVDPVTRGDPESALRWTTKSTPRLAAELTAQGHKESATTAAKLLKATGYCPQVFTVLGSPTGIGPTRPHVPLR